MEQARVVVIGGGAVGVSVLYHLARKGWTDCVLLEKNELTAGSTWHAAGNCPTFGGGWGVMAMQRYSMRLYRELKDHPERPITYNVTGTLRLAHSKERMQEFERAAGMALAQGEPYELLSPAEAQDRYPFLETNDLEGVLWDAVDGDIDPASLTQALAGHARGMGAKVHRFRPATGVSRENGEWIVRTETGDIRCEYVVNAAGYYAQRVGDWFKPYGGRTVPMAVMSHQYLLTEEIPEIAAWTAETGRKLPMIRDVDSSYYLRQEKTGLNLGPYERNCRAHWVTPDDPMPDDFSFQLWADDLDRLEWYIEDAMARVPLLGTAGISKVINGPIPYTPDGLPLIGPMPGVPNAFEACVFTFGIAQAGGAGKLLADWIVEGRPEWDAWVFDPRRFTAHASDRDYTVAKAKEVYGHEYAMHFPRKHWPAGRGLKLSPVHDDLAARGAVWGCFNGWERALWFARPGDDTSLASTERWDRDGPWEARVREECLAVRDAVGVLDLCGFSRFRVAGPGVAAWLGAQITGAVPTVGRVGLGYFADDAGRIVAEMSIVRLAEEEFWLITAAAAQWHDREWIERTLPEALTLTDETAEWSTHLVTGPGSRALLGEIAEGFDPRRSWLSHQDVTIAGKAATLLRVSFAGELGWEIHSRVADTPAIWDALWAAGPGYGLRPFGMLALDSLRIEKGYRAWKQDLSTDYSVLAAGLGRFVRWDHDFLGRAALERERQQGTAKAFAALTVQAEGIDAPYMANVWSGDTLVGETTSGAYGHRTERSIALAMIRSDLALPGTALEVEIFGTRYPATVQNGAHYDPSNERQRA
ncbi:GcvT family protein [Jannaschia seohaensis]|uniref:Dimethylglycine dehydrogenase n=1 Tax=Jannaschia seohaensis TaxID=475081 RepID=A0A2Y9B3U1_9RHOB|nr:FAD-dependent oxidoreductase [Jannaschia seohaensis]PWJ14428.1 dimethylglycine dehydrogenase [Jannaschia seohaensis]SSA50158.1 dimethylglycine dehydrogenase [Jannaschia seohaensis]